MPVAIIADIVQWAIFGGVLAGTISTYCKNHPGPGCVNKRDLEAIGSAPKVLFGRQEVGPCNVPKYNFDICRDQLHSQGQVWSSIPSAGVGRFENVPPACMNLAVVLSGTCDGSGPRPTPCGSACIEYSGLSDDDFRRISSAFS
ncbi:hypothetical protein QBC47DRAFT_308050 [Echria macrotheca]|uniref:Uncharacterized protein n=1 Tax=Echria macrotheca TaxID=438768 RepID=A0AAJ0F7T2_9PEZI|nr:hypothetical protein QBC47DRAFT_308050 [Echria macrotheca]